MYDVRLIRELEGSRLRKRLATVCGRGVKISCTGEIRGVVDNEIYGTNATESSPIKIKISQARGGGNKKDSLDVQVAVRATPSSPKDKSPATRSTFKHFRFRWCNFIDYVSVDR